MTYLGNTPTTQNFISGTDYFNGTGAQTAFTLSRAVGSINDIQVTVNNVVQQPNDAYTLSGTTLTMTSAPSAGTNNVYVRYLSTTTQSITPSQNTVSWNTLDANTQQDLGLMYKNKIINGNMAIFQRGTAATSNLTYSVDRWRFDKGNDATESVSQNTDAPVGFNYSLRNTISVGDATIGAAQFSGLQQTIEGYNIADLGWGTANAKTVTLSFWVRSSVTGQYTGSVRNSDDTRINPYNITVNTANTWEYKTVTITGDTGGTWNTTNGGGMQITLYAALGSNFTGGTANTWGTSPNFGCGTPVNGIASNGNIFAITGVQLEVGTQATTFTTAGGSYGAEFFLCQRYYYRTSCLTGGQQSTPLTPMGWAYTTSNLYVPVVFPQPMRGTPTLSRAGGFAYNPFIGGVVVTNMIIQDASNVASNVQVSSSAGYTNNTAYWVGPNTVASDFIAFSAEL
jgi:hypothetical protein